MVCPEYRQLEQQFEDATLVWAKLQVPETLDLPRRERADRLKQEALVARNKAADLLFLHRRCCLQCKSEG